MKPFKLEKTLLAAARATLPSDRVPYGFEKRVMAHILSRPIVDVWAQWSHALWRSALACLALVTLLGTFSVFAPEKPPQTTGDLSVDFEKTLLAAMDSDYAR